ASLPSADKSAALSVSDDPAMASSRARCRLSTMPCSAVAVELRKARADSMLRPCCSLWAISSRRPSARLAAMGSSEGRRTVLPDVSARWLFSARARLAFRSPRKRFTSIWLVIRTCPPLAPCHAGARDEVLEHLVGGRDDPGRGL